MAIRTLLLLSLFLATVTSLAFAYEEAGGGGDGGRERELRRELEQCQQRCQTQHREKQQQQQCQRRCQQQYEERRREEEERQERERRRRDENVDELNPREPEREELQRCQQTCAQRFQQRGQERQLCERRCQERYEEQRRERQERERGRDFDVVELNPHHRDDPQRRFEECQQSCRRQHSRDQRQFQECQQRCQERYEEERGERQERERRGGGDRDAEVNPQRRDEPQRRFEECQRSCQRQQTRDPRQAQECQQRCREQYEEERRRQERERRDEYDVEGRETRWEEGRERQWEGQRESRDNPYHVHSHRLQSRFRTDEGHFRVLEKLSERSELLRGLENHRLAVLEAAPNTFVAPHHCDADAVFVVTRGRGTISIVRQNNKESHNIERSDVVAVPAGSTVYLINQDNTERLQIVKLVTPVNIPGQFEEYFPAGSGENPPSYFGAFSTNATEEQIERLIGEQRQGQREVQRQGYVKKASQEQLRALSQHATSPRRRGRESSGPISLQQQSPLYSNDYGKFYEVNPEQNKQLKNMDVLVNWAELRQNSIMVPHYNSKATILVLVVEGTGRIEMACPHLSRQRQQRGGQQEEESQSGRYERVTAQLSTGDVYIIPAGHPVAVVASGSQTLRMVGFGVNARNNERNFIAGKDNIIKQLEREAKELAFNMPGREVEQIFNQQPKMSHFVPQDQSQQQQEEGRSRSHPLASILNVAAFA
ncbi:Bicupin, oxalate decarboxylase/oxidase [Trema orientale]|uniref:Bicupin, oxalate decarboxylase/oxidase n=1 Tax=Trema orientale TaxID=63057 RepID=A0A2P5FWH4_TREOI|nr:Bicupin, oxalate decarboxylase/oxidase [Trema orientale]